MNDTQPTSEPTTAPRSRFHIAGRLWRLLPAVIALAGLAAVAFAGQATGWTMPKASALLGEESHEESEWCEEHSVPEAVCVTCNPQLLPPPPRPGWCKEHGVHNCPYCNPSVSQSPFPVSVTPGDLDRAKKALEFAPRAPNGRTCRMQDYRVQIASGELVNRLGIGIESVGTGEVVEGVTAPGEVVYDPTRVAQLSARVPGVVRRIEKQVGDRVTEGEVVALVDAAEVGKAKAEFQQAVTLADLRAKTLEAKKSLGQSAGREQDIREAEAALAEANLRLTLAEQALANLGLPIRAEGVKRLSPTELAARLRFLGIPDTLWSELARGGASGNLLPVRAPFGGEVISRAATTGQTADPAKPLLTVADASRVWLTLRVRYEDASRVAAGQPVRFRFADHSSAEGTVSWVSPAADEKTRTVPVRVELDNRGGKLRAHASGTGFIVLRREKEAVVVPTEAVHWEGCCNVVFVADRSFDEPGGYKVFHVRKVRPGAKDVTPAGTPVTEVIAGVLPGERVAVDNSGLLRSELLRNNLGAG